MNFTREPIIESVISPKDGCKLVVRNSKSSTQEEYTVDALEIVSFGQALFLRSLERPKSFLLPMSDYEVIEVRETRMVLKVPSESKSKKAEPKKTEAKKEEPKKRRKRRRRKSEEPEEATEEVKEEAAAPVEPPPVIPPPETLIHESIERYKEMLDIEAPKVEAEAAPSDKIEEPALIPPGQEEEESSLVREELAKSGDIAKGLGIFSASRFLKRLSGEDKD